MAKKDAELLREALDNDLEAWKNIAKAHEVEFVAEVGGKVIRVKPDGTHTVEDPKKVKK